MGQIERTTSKGQLVAFVFGDTDVAASQTDAQLLTPGGGAGYIMPFPGEVVAVSAHLSAAGSAGQLTFGATIGGTEQAATTRTITTQTASSGRHGRGRVPFVSGAELGAEITTDAGWNGTTADLTVVVFVLLYLEGI